MIQLWLQEVKTGISLILEWGILLCKVQGPFTISDIQWVVVLKFICLEVIIKRMVMQQDFIVILMVYRVLQPNMLLMFLIYILMDFYRRYILRSWIFQQQ